MSFAPTVEAMTLTEVRAEMDSLLTKLSERGGLHPSEYWRWKDLVRVEESLLGRTHAT
jgi:hypothetical protein